MRLNDITPEEGEGRDGGKERARTDLLLSRVLTFSRPSTHNNNLTVE